MADQSITPDEIAIGCLVEGADGNMTTDAMTEDIRAGLEVTR
ncbi:hypothetical protein [Cryobacterium sp. BB307]|nr:hypothetical protein [Cryobacterium sp. BB307]